MFAIDEVILVPQTAANFDEVWVEARVIDITPENRIAYIKLSDMNTEKPFLERVRFEKPEVLRKKA